VVKVGTSVLTDFPVARVRSLAADVAVLREGGADIVLVTSGSVNLGMARLDLKRRPRQLPLQQAASAVGQVALIQAYEDALRAHRIPTAQVLISHDDLSDPARFLRARHTLMALLDYGVVPLINENDSVAVEEILDSDNDLLAARLIRLVEADLLAMLTSAEGIYAASPRRGGQVISVVREIDDLACRVTDGMSKGKVQRSLASKVRAAQLAAKEGVPTLVASGIRAGVLSNILDDETIGTLLLPARVRRSRKRWIAEDVEPRGIVHVTEEAHAYLVEGHHSLQCAGVKSTGGQYRLGDVVGVVDPSGNEFARGLVGFHHEELDRIRGLDGTEIEKALGSKSSDEVIRRDDLIIL
jgi:glutamate 5-kinase